MLTNFIFISSEKLMLNHPELRSEVVSLLPTPDLSDMEERLNFLKKNIYKVQTPRPLLLYPHMFQLRVFFCTFCARMN